MIKRIWKWLFCVKKLSWRLDDELNKVSDITIKGSNYNNGTFIKNSFVNIEPIQATTTTVSLIYTVPNNLKWNPVFIKALSINWSLIAYRPKSRLISFKKDGVRLNWYYTTGTISTTLMHPKKKKTQLFRKRLTQDQQIQVLIDPRANSGRGYYKS
tara:strand:+ start:2207 stop:2674 length:468 start_codon:yes stop_codon:yes gene_type:complete